MTASRSVGTIRGDHPVSVRTSSVAAARVTRIASGAVIVGVLVQAVLAGGFLAGHASLTQIHLIVGSVLLVAALTLVGTGLIGRRRQPREPTSLLATRFGVLIVLLGTAGAGLGAGGGTRDLLMVHIPLAIISMGLSSRLFDAASVNRRADEDSTP